MKLVEGDKEITINTISNWPLIEDLFAKWGYKVSKDANLDVMSLDTITAELSAWGIPWKRTKWNY